MSDSTPQKASEPSDESFSTPLSQMKESGGRDLAKKAFQKKLPNSTSKQGSSMRTEIVEAAEEPHYVQEHPVQSTAQQQEEWQQHWTEEGYLYYYNSKSGESVWAELDDPNYGAHASYTQSGAANYDDKGKLAASETESDDDDSTEYSEESSDDDESDDSEEYDSEDAELGLQGQRKFRGDMLLNAELEDDFQEYLASEQGKADMEKEQRAINRRLEQRFKDKQQKALRMIEKEARGTMAGKQDKKGREKKDEGQVLSPAEAVGGALRGMFSGVAKVTAPLVSKAGTVVDNYWKGKYHDGMGEKKKKKDRRDKEKATMKEKGERSRQSLAHSKAKGPPTEEARSAELLEAAMGEGEEDNTDTDSDSEATVASLSSEDSDVQELVSPLLPTWLRPKKLRKLVGKKAVTVTHDLATSTLTSLESMLEWTGYGVTVMSQMVWGHMNAMLKNLVDEHYSGVEGATLEGGERVVAPVGATTQAYLVPAHQASMPPSQEKGEGAKEEAEQDEIPVEEP